MIPRTATHPPDAELEGPAKSKWKESEVREQLRAILSSPAFQGSRRCQQFLEYVTDRTLAGEGPTLKEKTIAVEVFGRDLRTELTDDTIVRVSAREVRKRLAQYYVSEAGVAAPIRIELPSGTYVPEFRPRTVPVEPEVLKPAVIPVGRPANAVSVRWRVAGAALAVFLVFAGIMRWNASRAEGPFDAFWSPILKSSDSVLVTVANPLVYYPSARAQQMSAEKQPVDDPSPQPLTLPANLLDGSDMVPVFNQYVGVGDMVAAVEASTMLARHNKAVRIRLSSGVEFADLRGTQTLLIGAVTNRWTMEMQKTWRFQFRRSAGVRNVIVDTMDESGTKPAAPANQRQWSLPIRVDGSAQEDYILLCRIPNSFTGGMMLVTAGMRQFGTEAGGRLLTDRTQLSPVLAKLPAGWETRNLQVVLHVRVIGNAPAQPEVVAWHLW